MSTPLDDQHRPWPVTVKLNCFECPRILTIRTHSLEAAKRTTERAGWTFDAWPKNEQRPLAAWCPDCGTEPEDDI